MIFNYGSLNIDYVYRVEHLVRKGETINTSCFDVFPGGKGLNQSIAVARAGGKVKHFGKVGKNGKWLIDLLRHNNVQSDSIILSCREKTGHAIIQVDKEGNNAIFLYAGANKRINRYEADSFLSEMKSEDMLLLQNELNYIPYAINKAGEKGAFICFNPAPMEKQILEYPLEKVAMLVINQTEGRDLTGKKDKENICTALLEKYSSLKIVLTLGEKGVFYMDKNSRYQIKGKKVKVVDTTAAGDTFIGYLCACLQRNMSMKKSLALAVRAASRSVPKRGASVSIPLLKEVMKYK
jgi:ribokinase